MNSQAHITQPHHTCPQIIQILILLPTNATKDAHELIINDALEHLQNSISFLEQRCILILPLNAQIFIAHWIRRKIVESLETPPFAFQNRVAMDFKINEIYMIYMDENVAFVKNIHKETNLEFS